MYMQAQSVHGWVKWAAVLRTLSGRTIEPDIEPNICMCLVLLLNGLDIQDGLDVGMDWMELGELYVRTDG